MQDKYGVGNDPAFFPGTRVLKNKLNLQNQELLTEAEAAFAATAAESIEIAAPPFDLSYLCELHRQLFDEVYEWAGQLRTVDISKGHTRFCRAIRIGPEATRLFANLAAQQNFIGLARLDLVRRTAELYGELNMIHPFRDGNGRTLRLFFDHLILVCGYAVSWKEVDQDEWIDACIAAVVCDYSPLETVFDRCIGNPLDQ